MIFLSWINWKILHITKVLLNINAIILDISRELLNVNEAILHVSKAIAVSAENTAPKLSVLPPKFREITK